MTGPHDSGAAASASTTRPPLPGRRWVLGTVAGAATLAGLGLALWQGSRQKPPDSEKLGLWNLSFDTPSAAPLQMRTLAGRPLLLNFWATWCPPCVDELPLLDRFFVENASNGWQVVGLAVDQVAAVRTFLQRMPLQFPVAMAGMAGIELSKTLGNVGGGLPFTVVVGAAGAVLHRKMGRVTPQDLNAWRSLR